MLKHFFIEKTKQDDEGKEYDPGSLQTYQNCLPRYFIRPCLPAPDNFDMEKNEEFAHCTCSHWKKKLRKCGPQEPLAFKILARFSILFGGTLSLILASEHLRSNTAASCKTLPSLTSTWNIKNARKRIAKRQRKFEETC